MLGICSPIVSHTMKQAGFKWKKANEAEPINLPTQQLCIVQFIKRVFLFSFILHGNRVQGTIDLDHGEWDIQARAKNTDRWSDDRFAQTIPIKIPKGMHKIITLLLN